MSIQLEEITKDDYIGMICAGYMLVATFPSRSAFEAADFTPEKATPGPYRATEGETFNIWADDPRFK